MFPLSKLPYRYWPLGLVFPTARQCRPLAKCHISSSSGIPSQVYYMWWQPEVISDCEGRKPHGDIWKKMKGLHILNLVTFVWEPASGGDFMGFGPHHTGWGQYPRARSAQPRVLGSWPGDPGGAIVTTYIFPLNRRGQLLGWLLRADDTWWDVFSSLRVCGNCLGQMEEVSCGQGEYLVVCCMKSDKKSQKWGTKGKC